MAIDGNFSLELEVRRLVDRRPEIKCRLADLLKKGDSVTEHDVVHGFDQLVLHPNYTIPLLGGFRPIAQKILDRTIVLLHMVPNLRWDDEDCMEEFDEEDLLRETGNIDSSEAVNIIDIYASRRKGLRLHELACLAFCRAFDLIPSLLGTILYYFKAAPAPFERFILHKTVSKSLIMGPNQFLKIVRTSYRLLTMEPDVFITFWDWSCYLDLAQQSRNLSLLNDIDLRKTLCGVRVSDVELRKIISDIRWCSIEIISSVLHLSFKASANLGLDPEESIQSYLRWQEFCMEVSLEKGGWYIESPAEETLAHCLKSCTLSSLSTSFSVAREIVPSCQTCMVDTWNSGNPFILTSNMMKSFEMVSLAVSQRWPVLIYGPAGSGKTALINKFAQSHGSKVLLLHVDEQFDGKTLLGSYVSTEQPGEFRWQPGSLSQAVLNGFWVVFEDIDKSPPEILSILLPLLEGANLFVTGCGEVVRVNDNFRLFSTVTSSNLEITRVIEGRSLLGAVWRKVMISSPSHDDLLNIVLKWYPELESLAPKLIESFERVNDITRYQLGLSATSSYHDRFTLRDILKFCKRIASLGFSFAQDRLSTYAIYKEAVDVFASFSTSAGNRLAIMRQIAMLWNIPAAETLYPINKPAIQEMHSDFQVGRVVLPCTKTTFNIDKKPFVELRGSVHALEKIACSAKFNEPVLLVGETGTGKTTLVQSLATRLGQKLTVLNLSQQSDVADLLGGFKPVDARFVCIPLYQEFENLFNNTFSSKDNESFLSSLRNILTNKNWKHLLSAFQKGVKKIVEIGKSSSSKKRKRPLSEGLLKSWENFSMKLERAQAQVNASDGMVFSFVEGAFVTALRKGEWILLDEVNLAPPEILQRVMGVLEDEKGSLCLSETGDIDYVCRHPNFRMFACMNPATDAGKRDLPFSVRSRFTEYFVDDLLDDEDLGLFINQFMDDSFSERILISKIVQFYKAVKENEERLQDGANQKPHYSLRSLYRALEYFKKAKRSFRFEKSLYDGFSMFFLNLLDDSSAKLMNDIICKYLLEGARHPPQLPFDKYLTNNENSMADDSYVLTKSVKEHLKKLAQAIFIQRYPVLLQGPTSSGKTSLVWFLAAITGHEFVRINNHEHTDLQEYLGSYITDGSGKLVFEEGALVKAVRNGHWIVLDELNLAPSDVLEALNRLLDDNRELFVPELSETIRAHPDFMLFATQNPPIAYGGRKILSRAFRNRFLEIHVDEIPREELTTILEKRCKIPESHARKMVNVMMELQLHRQSSKVFAGKHGFITPRDLFRWADRFRTYGSSYEDLALDGYYLLAERLRDDAEKTIVKEVLEQQLGVKLSEDVFYKQENRVGLSTSKTDKCFENTEHIEKIIWTKSMRRSYFLVERCYKMREPVLLIGETGGGKTTICQLLSIMLDSKLHILNCHQYTETSDFIGGFYPVRERSRITADFQKLCDMLIHSKAFNLFPGDAQIFMDINQGSVILSMLDVMIKSYREQSFSHHEVTENEISYIEKIYQDMCQQHQMWQTIFVWLDGPLVEAMKRGDLFLTDEISLADDSVLERLNSVLEPERKLSLAEKGSSHLENIVAHPDFFLLATMNPGSDFGKRELSPALRNRFTEIWVPSVCDIDELGSIALERIVNPKLSGVVNVILNFWEWFNQLQTGRLLTVRDLLSWVSFINVMERSLSAESAFIHGAFLVVLDGLSLGTSVSKSDAAELRQKCLSFLQDKLKDYNQSFDSSRLDGFYDDYGLADLGSSSVLTCNNSKKCGNVFGIHPFYIEKGTDSIDIDGFEFQAPTTRRNSLRVLRAMQLNKPVLLEGSPGVGKTSLVVALGRFSGHTVVRINLSEQTDIMDLLGSDLPVECDEGIQFAWSDGILLQALKKGSWVLLDELNLAPQSVLEGLNAILDHRAEVFIPELGRSFKCPKSFRVFACQNPSFQGGGRKGLPKSFLNRFTKVYVDELVEEDYVSICSSLFPSIERSLLTKLVLFNKRLHQETTLYKKFGQEGSPWECNLRDVIRSCQIIQDASHETRSDSFLSTVYLQRMRTATDRKEIVTLYEQTFGLKPSLNFHPRVHLNPCSLIVGDISVERNRYQSSSMSDDNLKILPCLRHSFQAAMQCVKHQWLCILVGPPSSGKTSLVRLLAKLTGNTLNELNLSSATDISELLGCFEQHNVSRHYNHAIALVEKYMNEYCNLHFEYSVEALIDKKDLITRWLAFLSNINNGPTYMSQYIDTLSMRKFISCLVDIIEHLKLDNCEEKLSVSWSNKDLDNILILIRKLEVDTEKRQYSVKFEWVTGLLIKAIENGEWIVLENANLCNPTVLDRINSLVEQSGSITISECGMVEGKSLVLHPHPKFRMFLTVNPSYGEVSRAMRNRGIEIYLMKPYWLVDEISGKNLDEIELTEVKRFISLSGIPVGKLVEMMAKAHIYVMHEGSRFNINISYLELSRWVQLFQRLITNGNRPAWSIQISWMHTYLSSFGEGKGKEIVSEAAIAYLSMPELYRFTVSEDCLLCLPGGWPTPLKLRDYVCYSEEASIRQNCMYLESLGSQIASCMHSNTLNRGAKGWIPIDGDSGMIYQLDATLLHGIMFRKASHMFVNGRHGELDLVLAQKKLMSAADWVIEQATVKDYRLYIQWFDWFNSRLQPFFSFFSYFSYLLKKELQHTIWTRIFHLLSTEQDSSTCPIFSMELPGVHSSVDHSKSHNILLTNSIKYASLLRLGLRQWGNEDGYNHSFKTQPFEPILASLRRVEEKVFCLLIESKSPMNFLFKIFSELLEHHTLFWNSIISSQVDRLLISWRSLMKDARKLQKICPLEVEKLRIDIKAFDGATSLHLNSRKSLLWTHGGHPILPPSAELYQKQCQLSNFCKMLWPRLYEITKLGNVADNTIAEGVEFNEVTFNVALSIDVELRLLAMQGVCMSSYIISKADDDALDIIQKLEEMYQILLGRLEFEKRNLEVRVETSTVASWPEYNAACCVLTSNTLYRKSGFECWLKMCPIVDETSFFLDMKLLQNLTEIVVANSEEPHDDLSAIAGCLESSLNFSLNYSSRPPTDFLPHQKILWTLDAWESVQGANEKISSFVMEMWLKWHVTLWEAYPMLAEIAGYDILMPHKIFQPLKSIVVNQILKDTDSIREYPLHCLQLRVASHNIWYSSTYIIRSHDMLLSSARSLFKQIIYAHNKSFEDSTYLKIRSVFHSIQGLRNPKENIKALVSLLASSNHHVFTSLIDSFIEPALNELYPGPYDEQNIGCAMLRIGCLRYHLLICCDDLDPAVKCSIKYSELTEKIASLQIEIQVRKECAYLSGITSLRNADNYRVNLLEKLNMERTKLKKKLVFRSDSGKFRKLKRECNDFLKLVAPLIGWIEDVKNLQIEQVTERLHNWQETASCFIDRLSSEYSAYLDIIEPVQIAIYEMKLGMSLFVSSVLYKRYLANRDLNMELVHGTIYTFMRFPRGCASKTISINAKRRSNLSTCDIDFPISIAEINMDLLNNIASSTRDTVCDMGEASAFQFELTLYHNVLARTKISVADARFLGDDSFRVLHDIFDKIANYWMDMMEQKHKIKVKKSQQFSFRSRSFRIESITQIDVSKFANLLASDSFLEWQEILSEEVEEKIRADKECDTMEHDWNLTEESNLDDMINIHNQLFGSVDLILKPGSIQVSDADRLSSFLGSYMLGIKMMRDLKGSCSSIFDAKIVPEHLLALCMDHDNKFSLPNKSTGTSNFYKDSNSSELTKLVKPVTILKTRILFLLKEWDDHPALQRILEVISMILALPLDTPLSKALSSLQFLLSRIWTVQETVVKFPLSDQLEPIFALISSWHKLEFESWPSLLDEVQSQIERSAGRLWFPLYTIFQRSHADDIDQYNHSTIGSLEDFFRTSGIGEFKKQLQLLLSLHGHITTELCRTSNRSPYQLENLKILYNTFGFYVQFLPRILEYIETNRRSIEVELKELLKLCRWDRIENHLAFENMKRTRQKLQKIVQKYMDLLQQPLIPFLGQFSHGWIKSQTDQGSGLPTDLYDVSRDLLDTLCDKIQFKVEDRFVWLTDWWKSLEFIIQSLHSVRETYIGSLDDSVKSVGEVMNDIKCSITSQSSCFLYWENRKKSWHSIERICNSLIHCGEIWENKHNKLRKSRALTDLLKLLDNCGLSKHKTFIEGQSKLSWLRQPSYEVQHLLLSQSDTTSGNANVLNQFQSPPREIIWIIANNYYFKNISSMQVLEGICLEFHKDFSLVQVKRSGSYACHLLEIQQEQRKVAYNFSKKLKCLRHCMCPLSNLFSSFINFASDPISGISFAKNQNATFKCMWQQKQLFDGFCAIMYEEYLLLQTAENNHLKTCSTVKNEVEKIRMFIQNILPDFQKSKNLLDQYLLGSEEDITMDATTLHPYGVTTDMEHMVVENFQLIKTFEKNLSAFRGVDGKGAAKDILLGHFEDLFAKVPIIDEELNASFQSRNLANTSNDNSNQSDGHINELKLNFYAALKGTYKKILDVFQRVGSLKSHTEESLMNMSEWKTLFEKDTELLQLDLISGNVMNTIQYAGELLNYCGDKIPSLNSSLPVHLRHLYALLDVILTFGDNLLRDFLETHIMVCRVAYVIANSFASVFAKGFGTVEEQENDSAKEKTQDSDGTGMGEGAGVNDVSDQINDEDQLLGTSDKANEERDAMLDKPSKSEKGIEMEHKFEGDAFSVSEDSEDNENEDDDQEELESAMGEVGANQDIVDEKPGDMDDDDGNHDPVEKYETGSSVKDATSNDEELRAREDSAATNEDAKDLKENKSSEKNAENGDEESCDGPEDMSLDKDNAFADPSGINLDEQNQRPEEDIHMTEQETTEPMDDYEAEDFNSSEVKNDEEKMDTMDQSLEETDLEHSAENAETVDAEENDFDAEMDIKMPNKDSLQSTPNLFSDNNETTQSLELPKGDSESADLRDYAANATFSNFNEFKNELAPISGPPSSLEFEVGVTDSMGGRKLSHQQSRTSLPPSESSNRKSQPNPCRSVGDAVEGWKERVKVSIDLQEQIENSDDLMNEDADEYGYTAKYKEGTAQALGPATADQINGDIIQNDVDRDVGNTDRQDPSEDIEIDKQTSETGLSALTSVNDVKKQHGISDLKGQQEELKVDDGDHDQDYTSLSDNLIHIERSFMSVDFCQLSKFSVNDEELGKAICFEPSAEARDDAVTLWKRYEVITTKLSQELVEQLRLVMEPTLASRLQGDYRTGKRINMKKVIPYIASHYRKDKIWLRRTRPSKRDYQVVIAMDDSRSMLEGQCETVAVEALVTVCRAMSQLEVGKLAVASFGQQGNIRLLHEFDQPFTPEAGIKMISSLTFKQENTIADQPMVDQLKYLNNMLDTAAMHARLPSGYNPLQQLVLIISDGHLNEKQKLKRYVRDILSKKRMVAFLLLDNPKDSITELKEITVQGTDVKHSKYLDSFPFPFYVVLKNIESLPRTLADLLRQWFELMQYSKDS